MAPARATRRPRLGASADRRATHSHAATTRRMRTSSSGSTFTAVAGGRAMAFNAIADHPLLSRRGPHGANVMLPPITRLRTRAYQFSLRAGKPPDDVLGEFAQRPMPGIAVAERGPNYLVLRPQQRRRYGGDVAVLLGLAIVLAVLILTAVTPVLIVLLPLALVPGVPLLVDNRPDLAISAVADDLGGTRVTVHGQASSELAAALDAYLGSLPRLTLENIGSGPQG